MNRTGAADIPFIKIALIGDSGVGKSTLSSVLATGCFESSPIYRPTVGCVIKVLSAVHESQGKYFIELWDLGGNPRFSDARPICYQDCDGYIFLWDSSSEVTYHSLQTWLSEVSKARDVWSSNSSRRSDYLDSNGAPDNLMDSDDFSLEGGHERLPLKDARENEEASSVPLLIVGNKVDKLSASGKLTLQAACAQQVFVSSRSADDYDPTPFYRFFDEVYDKGRSRQQENKGVAVPPPATVKSTNPVTQDFELKISPISSDDATRHQLTPTASAVNEPEVTWTSPLRGFTSSLFSLSSSASSLRYRSTHTPDHTHTHMPEKI